VLVQYTCVLEYTEASFVALFVDCDGVEAITKFTEIIVDMIRDAGCDGVENTVLVGGRYNVQNVLAVS